MTNQAKSILLLLAVAIALTIVTLFIAVVNPGTNVQSNSTAAGTPGNTVYQNSNITNSAPNMSYRGPNDSVQILSAVPEYASNLSRANLSGKRILFVITFKNTGNDTVYITSGCQQAIKTSITPNSSATFIPTGAGACALAPPTPLSPGAVGKNTVPGYSYIVISNPGVINASFNLTWYTSINKNSNGLSHTNSTPHYTIFSKSFTFG